MGVVFNSKLINVICLLWRYSHFSGVLTPGVCEQPSIYKRSKPASKSYEKLFGFSFFFFLTKEQHKKVPFKKLINIPV